ncbi:MAG: anthranilate synthase component I family protein [Bacteroidota bacterium]
MINTIQSDFNFVITDFQKVKEKMLNWVQRFDTFCFLDNHQYQIDPHSIECLLAVGVKRQLKASAGNALDQLQHFIDSKPRGTSNSESNGWLFGHLGYDLKNEIEKLSSDRPGGIDFPDLFFFEPEIVIRLNENEMIIEADHPEIIFQEIDEQRSKLLSLSGKIEIENRLSKENYISIIEQLKQHILRGDCYEINFCQEFFAKNAGIDPIAVYNKLSEVSPNPFSALYKVDDQWLLCASPERFLKKKGNEILSQPIKGTSKRNVKDAKNDKRNKDALFNSAKERSENVMVVDLVRNDLAKVCEEGTVKVDELYGIYTFPQLHQMISTVSGKLKKNILFSDIIKASFPMGSMTGAPKKRVMELIEKYESTRRGIFSGAVGYISPEGDFDFNVVIRSIMYNAASGYLSFQAGSAITFHSDPEKEWEECLLKAEAIKKVLDS